MKYKYNEKNQELIDKLKSYKLNKPDERQLITNFLKENKITPIGCLFNKLEEDTGQETFKKKYIKTIVLVVILSIILVVLGLYSVTYLNTSMAKGLDTTEKVIFALLALLFHVILLADFILIFKSEIILKNNMINKLRNNL